MDCSDGLREKPFCILIKQLLKQLLVPAIPIFPSHSVTRMSRAVRQGFYGAWDGSVPTAISKAPAVSASPPFPSLGGLWRILFFTVLISGFWEFRWEQRLKRERRWDKTADPDSVRNHWVFSKTFDLLKS